MTKTKIVEEEDLEEEILVILEREEKLKLMTTNQNFELLLAVHHLGCSQKIQKKKEEDKEINMDDYFNTEKELEIDKEIKTLKI